MRVAHGGGAPSAAGIQGVILRRTAPLSFPSTAALALAADRQGSDGHEEAHAAISAEAPEPSRPLQRAASGLEDLSDESQIGQAAELVDYLILLGNVLHEPVPACRHFHPGTVLRSIFLVAARRCCGSRCQENWVAERPIPPLRGGIYIAKRWG